MSRKKIRRKAPKPEPKPTFHMFQEVGTAQELADRAWLMENPTERYRIRALFAGELDAMVYADSLASSQQSRRTELLLAERGIEASMLTVRLSGQRYAKMLVGDLGEHILLAHGANPDAAVCDTPDAVCTAILDFFERAVPADMESCSRCRRDFLHGELMFESSNGTFCAACRQHGKDQVAIGMAVHHGEISEEDEARFAHSVEVLKRLSKQGVLGRPDSDPDLN